MVWVKQKAHQHIEFMYYGPTSKIIYYAVYLEPAQKYILGQQNKLGRTLNGNDHSVIFLGEMQTKFYCQNIGTIVIFDKKMFKFLCHMIGSNHYWG